jgi:G3E family GTPase
VHPHLPVTVIASLDPVLRDLATASAVCDVPGTVVLRYDLGPSSDDGLRRVLSDLSGVLEDVTVPLDHVCLGCAQREDVLPTIEAVAASGRWAHLVLALPVTADPVPVAAALDAEAAALHVRFSGVVTVVRAATLTDDLFGDDLLAERGCALTEEDERSVGEALAGQLDAADVVVTDAVMTASTQTVLLHVCGPAVATLLLDEVGGRALTSPRHQPGPRRYDLRAATRAAVADTADVWTVELSSQRPFHPERLLERIADLGAGRLRARGTFWLPTRPETACAWDGAGGQLCVSDAGAWAGEEPRTRLVVTGTDPGTRERLVRAFADVLLTDEECGQDDWWAVEDGLEPWLGPLELHTGVPVLLE